MLFKGSAIGLFGLAFALAPSVLIGKEISKYRHKRSTDEEEFSLEFQKIGEEAEKAFEKMNDYSFKIFLPCAKFGTGWILDYEIPQNDHYPLKWYIATNAHVANHFKFVENPYYQELPKEMLGNSARGLIDTAELWKPSLSSRELCDAHDQQGYFDFNLSRQETGSKLRSNYGGIGEGKMKEPKLFYAPINFLKKDEANGIKDNNYKDFAVIEVEFTKEEYAKAVTGDFYDKYKAGLKVPLDVFSILRDKEQNKTKKEELEKRLYSLAYPYQKDNIFNYTVSYDEDLAQTSELARNVYGLSDDYGRVSANEIDRKYSSQMTNWYGNTLNRVGYFYLLDNFAMKGGASGGLVIDGEGNILGIRSLGDQKGDRTLVVPLRSSKEGFFRTPAYDLIEGGFDGQLTSYRQQVKKYILDKGKKTWLSERGGWEYAPRNNNYSIVHWEGNHDSETIYIY